MGLITLNVEGFYRNQFYLNTLLNSLTPKLIFIQEIWVPYHQENAMNNVFPEYSVLISTPDMFTPSEDLLSNMGPSWHGSAIMWHSSIDNGVTSIKTNNHRIAAVRVKLGNDKFLALSVYFPTSGKDDEYLECVTDIVNLVTENLEASENILIGTDTNCSK